MKKPSPEQLLADMQTTLQWKDIAAKHGYSDARFLRKLAVRYGLPPRRQFFKPDRETVLRLLGEGLNIYQIADYLGYGKGGWSNVYAFCRAEGIEFDFSPNQEIKERAFSPRQQSFLFGTLLGDGSLSKNGNHYSLRVGHSAKHAEFVMWKLSEMRDFVLADHVSETENIAPNGKVIQMLRFNTLTHPYLTTLREFCYPRCARAPDGVKTVSQKWLDKIDEFALAVWYMDDGSRNKCYGTLTLCTNGFTLEEQLLMQLWFQERWSIPVVVQPARNGQFNLRVNSTVAPKFLSLVRPFVPSCMAYKLGG